MPILSTVMRANMRALSPILKLGNMETARALQKRTGELMSFAFRNSAESQLISHAGFGMSMAQPVHTPAHGIALYLHGGGYVAGDLNYVKGYGAALASELGRRVLSVAYRLAPEHPYSAALEDAVEAYKYLLDMGYAGEDIAILGESAGGGLTFALALKLRDLGMPLPACLVAISPWTDLTLTGDSYTENEQSDPTLSMPMLEFYAESYAGDDRKNPYISPMYADLSGLPPTLIFVGGDEMLLSDSVDFAARLNQAGVECECHVEPGMWHVYVLYGIAEARWALDQISDFLRDKLF